jgi:ParB/RepB/Spo0J family partition protein
MITRRNRTIVEEFDPDRVRPLPDQPRKRFGGIRELAASIAEIGQSCPGVVTLVEGHADGTSGKYDAQLVDGERRLRACKLACVPFRAEVRDAASIEDLFVASFGANFGKQAHDAIEIAEGLNRMRAAGKSVPQMARIAGKSEQWVYSHLNLLKLHPVVQKMMIRGDVDDDVAAEVEKPFLTFQLAQQLVSLPEAQQLSMARRITKEGMSLAGARRVILRQRNKNGDADAAVHRRGPSVSMKAMDAMVRGFIDRVGVYVDMPGSAFTAMLDSADGRTKVKLLEAIEDLGDSLKILGSTIERQMAKSRAEAKKAEASRA